MSGHLMIEKLSEKQSTDATTANMPTNSGRRVAVRTFTGITTASRVSRPRPVA